MDRRGGPGFQRIDHTPLDPVGANSLELHREDQKDDHPVHGPLTFHTTLGYHLHPLYRSLAR